MEYKKIGNTELNISRLGIGCEPLGGTDWGVVDEKEIERAINLAIEHGCNFFDTADVYGLGRSEELLSRILGPKRHDFIIATKFGVNWKVNPDGGRAKTFRDSSPEYIEKAIENSLNRLKIDCIPLYQINWPDPKSEIEKTMEKLAKLKEDGKIKYIGCSNFSNELIDRAMKIERMDSVQMPYSLIERNVEENFSFYKKHKIGVLAYGPLGQGLLTGKYNEKTSFNSNDRRNRLEKFKKANFKNNLEKVRNCEKIGMKYSKTVAQTALRWLLDNSVLTATIVGIKSRNQLRENLGSLDWHLNEIDLNLLNNES